jgi:D-alanyl-D-alanine carboxypeptidase (penicillin-binding protein 5/6)
MALATPAYSAPTVAPSPTASPSPGASPTGSLHPVPGTLPPAAPSPTSTDISPGAPDPNPPLGGIGPDGHVVGGDPLITRFIAIPAGAPPLPDNINANAWVLVDLDSGAVLAARDPHGRYQPASILKLLTSVVLVPKLPGATVISPTYDDVDVEGSAVGIVENGKYTADDLFTALMLMSGNDAASALATAAGGVDKTVTAMNTAALDMGAYDTLVETPSGLDGWKQLTSAYDMALFLRAAVNEPRLLAYDQKDVANLPEQDVGAKHYGPVPLANQSYQFFDNVPGALLAKTGFTDAAEHTYAAAVQRNGRRLGVVLLRAQKAPLDQWQQAAALFDWGYALPANTAPVGALLTPPANTTAANTLAPLPSPNTTPAASTGAAGGSSTPRTSGTASPRTSATASPRTSATRISLAAAIGVLAFGLAAGSLIGIKRTLRRGRRATRG